MVLFEGRDTAGKDGMIKRIIAFLNPRTCRVVALPTPTERERTQWYFQRYVAHLPAAGEIVLFDRSWYNRAGVEHVMGYCTEDEYEEFLRFCPLFEQALQNDGIMLVKYWLSVSDDEQERRFKKRLSDPRKRWKFSPIDLQARARWVDYAEAKDRMFAYTDTEQSPWYVVEADDKRTARLNLIGHLLSLVPYEHLDKAKRRSCRRASGASICARPSRPSASCPSAIRSAPTEPLRDPADGARPEPRRDTGDRRTAHRPAASALAMSQRGTEGNRHGGAQHRSACVKCLHREIGARARGRDRRLKARARRTGHGGERVQAGAGEQPPARHRGRAVPAGVQPRLPHEGRHEQRWPVAQPAVPDQANLSTVNDW